MSMQQARTAARAVAAPDFVDRRRRHFGLRTDQGNAAEFDQIVRYEHLERLPEAR